MPLIKCPECGREVSDSAQACPSCGYEIDNRRQIPIQNRSMNQPYVNPPTGRYVQQTQTNNKHKDTKKIATPIVVASVFCVLIFMCVITSVISNRGKNDTLSEADRKAAEQREQDREEEKRRKKKETEKTILDEWLNEGREKYNSKKYLYVKFDDLIKNSTFLKSKKVYTEITVKSVNKKSITSESKKKKYIIAETGKRTDAYRPKLDKGDKIIIAGKVSKTEKNKIKLSGVYVVDTEENRSEYIKDKTDEKLTKIIQKGIEKLPKSDYKNYCKEMWHDDIFFSKDNLKGEYVKLEIFLEESRFLEEKDMLRDTVQELKDEYDIQRDFYACGVSRGEDNSYINGQIYIYFSNKNSYKATDYDQGQELIIWGKIAEYSKNNWTGYNNCIVIPKYIELK